MIMRDVHSLGGYLAWLAKRLIHLDQPYLITGPQAAYRYHRWLTPLENLVTLQVYTEDVPLWHQMGGDCCQVFERPPTTAQVQTTQEAVILDTALEPERYRRRRTMDGLAFVGPEDFCLDLVERARGETSPAEAAAIIIAQRDSLAWDLLLDQAERRGLVRRLGALLEAINAETEADLVPPKVIEELGRRVDTAHIPLETVSYPVGRHQSVPLSYQPIAERWGMRLTLPRYVIAKVVMDLQPQRS
ncbi:MAG: hypothetical protein H8D74_02130 [Chloroflexi bacterium]|nr:hypothetical protein [Chloroflexota bacterium]